MSSGGHEFTGHRAQEERLYPFLAERHEYQASRQRDHSVDRLGGDTLCRCYEDPPRYRPRVVDEHAETSGSKPREKMGSCVSSRFVHLAIIVYRTGFIKGISGKIIPELVFAAPAA
jgi:hypothetical protein